MTRGPFLRLVDCTREDVITVVLCGFFVVGSHALPTPAPPQCDMIYVSTTLLPSLKYISSVARPLPKIAFWLRDTAVHLSEVVAMFLISLPTRDSPLQLLTVLLLLFKYVKPGNPPSLQTTRVTRWRGAAKTK